MIIIFDLGCDIFQIVIGIILLVMAYKYYEKYKIGQLKRKTANGLEIKYTDKEAKSLIK